METTTNATTPRKSTRLLAAGIALGCLLVATQAVQAWLAWERQRGREATVAPLAPGQLGSVLLTNGQVYYGEFVDATARYVRLQNVYYVQAVVDPSTHQGGNRLVNRRKTDWHAPETMSVPMDKIVMIESVGGDSRLAQLIEQERKMMPPTSLPAGQP